ncbi:MAG: lysylphosphatidylglycerol synthase transmembrane domain-containing protein [Roseinatronobacter sp.]
MSARIKVLARALASLGLLAAVLWQFGAGDIVADLQAASGLWFALACLALSVQIPLSALRWRVTARALGLPLTRGHALSEYGLSVLVNTFLPGGVLGDLGRVLRMRHVRGWQMAAATVVIERLAGQIALALTAILGVGLWYGAAVGLALAGGMLALGAAAYALGRIVPKLVKALRLAWFARQTWPAQLGLSIAILGCNLFGFWAAARAVGISVPFEVAIFILPLTLMVMLVPVTLNGWGLREGAAALLWPLVDIAAQSAVAASVVFGAAVAGAALLGAVPWALYAWRTRHAPAPEVQGK